MTHSPARAAMRPDAGQGSSRRTALVVAALAVLALGGLVYALVSAGHAHAEQGRGPTAAERSAAAATAVALRWRTWTAGQIFPATLPYVTVNHPPERAVRLGISAGTSCTAALDPAAAAKAAASGCRAVLRAVYTDQLRGIVYTVGVAAFPAPRAAATFLRDMAAGGTLLHGDPGARRDAGARGGSGVPAGSGAPVSSGTSSRPGAPDFIGYLRDLPAPGPRGSASGAGSSAPGPGGLRALAVGGTAAARSTDLSRQTLTGWQHGPYVVLAAAGYADGRPAMASAEPRRAIFWPAPQLATGILRPLTTPPHVTCGQPGWRC